jgi:hypothetical protein
MLGAQIQCRPTILKSQNRRPHWNPPRVEIVSSAKLADPVGSIYS